MDYANVIPIDAEAARHLERARVQFRWLVAAVTGVWIAILIPTLLLTPLPPLAPFAVLAVLVVLAEHRFVLFGDETSMSASIIVIVASIFVFADTSPLAGPMLIASLGGLYFPHVRARALALMLANVSIFGLSALMASALSSGALSSPSASVLQAATAAGFCSVIYWYANSLLIGLASAFRLHTSTLQTVRAQATSDWPILLLAVAAGLVGIAFVTQVLLAALGVAILLLAFVTYVQQARNHEARTSSLRAVHPIAAVIALSAAISHTSIVGAAIASTGIFLAVACNSHSPGRDRAAVATVLCALCLAIALDRVEMSLATQFVTGTIFCVVALTAREIGWPTKLQRQRVSRLVFLGLLLPSRAEAVITASLAAFSLHAPNHMGQQTLALTAGLSILVGHLLRQTPLQPRMRSRIRSTPRRTSVAASR